MKSSYKNWQLEQNSEHIVFATLDKKNTSTNVLSYDVLEELDDLLAEISSTHANGLIFQSAKPNGFIAGADVSEFSLFSNYNDVLQAIQKGQSVMDRIDNLPFPSLALIHGFCLGGGLELALACDYRIAEDSQNTKLGLPEIKLGIHPGFGGSVRSNQLLGVFKAMDLMLSGRTLTVRQAKKTGLVDDIVAQRHLHKAALTWIKSKRKPHQRSRFYNLLELDAIRPLVAHLMKKKLQQRVSEKHYPAPFKLVNLWQFYADDSDIMMKQEAESVASLMLTPTSQNLRRVFELQNTLKAFTHPQFNIKGNKTNTEITFNRNLQNGSPKNRDSQNRDSQNKELQTSDPKLQHIHVIGGGIMGGDIAIYCAYKGFTVTVHDRSNDILARVNQRAYDFYTKKLKSRRLIQAAMDRLIPDIHNYGMTKADLLIEAIIEDVKAKQQVFTQALNNTRSDCILATNTSSIPLDTISRVTGSPERLVGIHFFNPVARMPLVEIVVAEKTSIYARDLACYFAGKIGKMPLPVSSTPGFLVNRILMPYLLEAMVLYEEGIPAAHIDKAARHFGMPMGPIELADKVGLDICLSVAMNLTGPMHLSVPEKLKTLVNQGFLGIKTAHGFYTYKNSKPVADTKIATIDNEQLVTDRLLFRLFNESVACLENKVVNNADLLDAGVIFGTGFAPFLGGPLHYIEQQGIQLMDNRLIDLSRDYGERFKPVHGWEQLTPLLQ
jgi:3-hydroxyacyl-CoA dehydrogenase/enoyl-CoA hydratase/3-hydroxybutyryl-CoA epimerase